MTDDGEVLKTLETIPASPEARATVDLALGVVGESIGAGLALLRGVANQPVLRSRAVWRPPFVPTSLQPATIATELVRRGAQHRTRAVRQVGVLVDQWTPVIVELLVSRVDLTSLVLRHLDIDRVVAAADLDAAVANVDLDAVVSGVDLDAAVRGVDIDAIAGRLDIEAVLARVDLVAMVEDVLAAIDLPAIIRDSSGSMASETVRGARMTGITVDDAISRAIERHVFRGRRTPRADPPMDAEQ